MNKDIGCVKNYYIPYENYDKDNPRYENGIMVIWGGNHAGTSGCWSTTGIAPGFTAGTGQIYSKYGAAAKWQLLSLDHGCGGTNEGTIMHEFIHAWGFKPGD